MHLRLLVLLALPFPGLAHAAEAPAPFAVWRLDNLETIAGHAVTVIGTPLPTEGHGTTFNGTTDGMVLETNPLAGTAAFTIEICFRPAASGREEQRFFHVEDVGRSRALLETRLLPDGRWTLDTFLRTPTAHLTLLDRSKAHPSERWTWVALTYADGKMRHFVNGVPELEGDVIFAPMTRGRTSLGVRQNLVSWFKGGIREVRFHHTALAATDLQRVE
ncbi:MAG TPA: LamG-like jellyroll fold domain-containing protein [Lacunisphaera sp.]|nr:LamG-like jellyroll fold domain-containing protein [Lacunisphaera sp.]